MTDVRNRPPLPILFDQTYDEDTPNPLRAVISKNDMGCFVAYVGVPIRHEMANKNHNDLDIDCHGGLTYSGTGSHFNGVGWYWFGWDYGHAWDFVPRLAELSVKFGGSADPLPDQKVWTQAEVERQMTDVLSQFRALVNEPIYMPPEHLIGFDPKEDVREAYRLLHRAFNTLITQRNAEQDDTSTTADGVWYADEAASVRCALLALDSAFNHDKAPASEIKPDTWTRVIGDVRQQAKEMSDYWTARNKE